MSTLSPADKRRAFAERFEGWLAAHQLAPLPAWFSPPFAEDNNVASFIDQEQRRCLRIEEALPGDLELDFFFAPAGMQGQHTELFFRARDVHDRVELVANVYRLWFIERVPQEELETVLNALTLDA